jgi:hypothetical protein
MIDDSIYLGHSVQNYLDSGMVEMRLRTPIYLRFPWFTLFPQPPAKDQFIFLSNFHNRSKSE